MKSTDEKEFIKCLAAVAVALGSEISKERIKLYFRLMEDMPIEEVKAGCLKAANECKFFPTPGEFRDCVHGSQKDRALRAWLEVQDAVRHLCANLSIDFGDIRTHATLEAMGGWTGTDNWPEDLQWKQKEFERIYLALQTIPAHTPAYLKGKDEIYALSTGRKWDKPPVLAGAQVRLAIEKKQAARPALPEPTKEEARKILAAISKRTGVKLLEAKP